MTSGVSSSGKLKIYNNLGALTGSPFAFLSRSEPTESTSASTTIHKEVRNQKKRRCRTIRVHVRRSTRLGQPTQTTRGSRTGSVRGSSRERVNGSLARSFSACRRRRVGFFSSPCGEISPEVGPGVRSAQKEPRKAWS